MVSGVVDAARGVHIDQIPQAALTVCRLRADREELTRRFVGRRGQAEGLEEVLREAEDFDASTVADVCVNTSGLTVAEVVLRVRERAGGWPVLTGPGRSSTVAHPTRHMVSPAGPILWLCGPTGVGKSTVGFKVYQHALRAGVTAAYIDLDQIGFCGPTPAGHQVKARNLAAMWCAFREAGADGLVMVGPVEDESALALYTAALPAATITLCRLHARRDQLTRRIMLRGQGGTWSQPGDPLVGQSAAHLRRIADRAADDAAGLEAAAVGHRIDTDGCAVEEIADMIAAHADWPGRVN